MATTKHSGLGVETLSPELRRTIVRVARTPRLLVGCDYDGTLAPIVAEPEAAAPLSESVTALRSLAGLHETTTAVISGRSLRDLATMSRLPAEVHLVGSHGSEFDAGFVHQLDPNARALRERLSSELADLIDGADGVRLEAKPAGFAVHLRNASDEVARVVADRVRRGPAAHPGVQAVEGKAVIDLSVVATDKGDALDDLRRRASASATVFIGDAVADERAFSRLGGTDVGIKVGDGVSLAGFRVNDPYEVAQVLAYLLEQRRAWLHGEQAPAIERLTMLADGRSVALLAPDGRVTWMCHPEPDSAALFADLLGGRDAGHFSVVPERQGLPLGQRYVPNTMTVETRWSGLLVTDYLDRRQGTHRTDLVRVLTGDVPADVEFAPRPDFGQVPVKLVVQGNGLRVLGTPDPITLYSPGVRWEISSDGVSETARAKVRPAPGRPVVLELRCGSEDLDPPGLAEPERRMRAERDWSSWVAGLRLPEVERDLVVRSALTLRALCHSTTGGIMAAATTSLPEEIGGVRNWDYRYCWLRDGALVAKSLVSLGSLTEAERFLGWLHRILATVSGPERLHPLYTLAGAPVGPEAVIDHLPGYAGSRPVRVGNQAGQQVQLDVFGPVVDLVADLADARGHLTARDRSLVEAMVEAVARRRHEPDHGIWEDPVQPRHHVYSKVMCWVAIDRALRLFRDFGIQADPQWTVLRRRIADDVLERGWNAEAGSFTTAYDGDDLDAATLHIGLSGLLDPADERFQATVTATEERLRSGSTVYRYHRDDGLSGQEGGFHLCTAWLVEAYLLTGRRAEAEELFKHLANAAGPTGLLPEEYDPVAERSLGNHPQAYSHLGLIRCAQLFSATD
ncbi:trehalose-phosphatase [Saccharomonospora sp. NPDC046836]|uniref:trehalose-phosphatase n=1 Tax=Saccharomonospora sp. NPDC046836 TaxID=3156921 RepID=UPI0033FB5629